MAQHASAILGTLTPPRSQLHSAIAQIRSDIEDLEVLVSRLETIVDDHDDRLTEVEDSFSDRLNDLESKEEDRELNESYAPYIF